MRVSSDASKNRRLASVHIYDHNETCFLGPSMKGECHCEAQQTMTRSTTSTTDLLQTTRQLVTILIGLSEEECDLVLVQIMHIVLVLVLSILFVLKMTLPCRKRIIEAAD